MNKILSSKTFGPLLIYLTAIIAFCFILNLFIQNYVKANYSEAKKEKLLSEVSKFRYFGENPCDNAIYGSPDANTEFIKVNIYCGDGRYSTNTLALSAVHPSTYIGAIQLVARINLYEADVNQNGIVRLGNVVSSNKVWRCFIDDSEISDYSRQVKARENISCYYIAPEDKKP